MDEPGLFLDHTTRFKYALNQQVECLRPYHVENTGSRPITEVKQRRARLVLGWVTAWEYRVLQTFAFFLQKYIFLFNLCFFLFLLCRTSIRFRILPSLNKCATTVIVSYRRRHRSKQNQNYCIGTVSKTLQIRIYQFAPFSGHQNAGLLPENMLACLGVRLWVTMVNYEE